MSPCHPAQRGPGRAHRSLAKLGEASEVSLAGVPLLGEEVVDACCREGERERLTKGDKKWTKGDKVTNRTYACSTYNHTHSPTQPRTKPPHPDKTQQPTYKRTVVVKPIIPHLDGTTPADGTRGPWVLDVGCAPLVAKAGRLPGATAERPGGSGEIIGPNGKGFLGTGGLGGTGF